MEENQSDAFYDAKEKEEKEKSERLFNILVATVLIIRILAMGFGCSFSNYLARKNNIPTTFENLLSNWQ